MMLNKILNKLFNRLSIEQVMDKVDKGEVYFKVTKIVSFFGYSFYEAWITCKVESSKFTALSYNNNKSNKLDTILYTFKDCNGETIQAHYKTYKDCHFSIKRCTKRDIKEFCFDRDFGAGEYEKAKKLLNES